MAELLSTLKRKIRHSSSDSESRSPDGKRICEESNEQILSTASSDDTDQILVALKMSEGIAQQLQMILDRLTSVEGKLDGVLQKVQSLESTMNNIQAEMVTLKDRTSALEGSANDFDAGLNNLNAEVQGLDEKVHENKKEIQAVNDRYLYLEVYSRRENLRFLGIPESESAEEDTKEVVYNFLTRELELEGAREIELQRVHRLGKKTPGVSRPIIARFLKFPERQRVFKRALEVKDEIEVKIYADYPKEIQERRKKQWFKIKRAREEGKLASFSKKEPDKLFIDGRFVPM